MPSKENYNMNYRPKTYWVYGDQHTKVEATVKGSVRRTIAKLGLEGDPVALTDPHAFDVSLTDKERGLRASMHPSLMGGEFLPDYDDGEVEIARVSYASVTADVVSVRARWFETEIHYSIVDEYYDDYGSYQITLKSSKTPLTFEEIISLIDTAMGGACQCEDGNGLVLPVLNGNVETGLDNLAGFVEVTSPFYPQLNDWYSTVFKEWLDEKLREEEDEDGNGSEYGSKGPWR